MKFVKHQKKILKELKLWETVKAHHKIDKRPNYTVRIHDLRTAFAWGSTPEGYQYWNAIANKLSEEVL